MSTVFRTASEPEAPVEQPKPTNGPEVQPEVKVEVPFTLYRADKGKSLIAEHYGIEEGWDDKNVYGKEIDEIEEYFTEKIEKGDIENSPEVIKGLLKKYEADLKLEKEDRTVVKIQKLIAYLDFKKTVDDIVRNNYVYGNK
jgi:hypothetical protein